VRRTDEENKTMIVWTEVEPQQFETYPPPTPLKGPDELDAVLEAVASGKTVEITLVDESVIRGRRLALGRRVKARGLTLQMRSHGNKLIARQAGPAAPAPEEPRPHPEQPRVPRKRKD